MTMMKTTLSFATATLVAAGIGAVAVAAHAQEAAPATITTKSGTIGVPQPGRSQVVFFRTGSLMGAALGCTVREMVDGTEVQHARLGSGKYYVVQMEPGTRLFYTTGEATDRLTMEIEEDETYFVRCNIGMGVVAGRANLSPSDRATFAQRAKGLALWKGPKEETATASR